MHRLFDLLLLLLMGIAFSNQSSAIMNVVDNGQQNDVSHISSDEGIYGYDTVQNSRHCCLTSLTEKAQERSFLAFVSNFHVTKGAKDLKPTLIQENPRNLIPTQPKSDLTGSQLKRLTKSMKKDGFDQTKPVDAWRNPKTGRLEIQDGHHRTEAAKKAGLDKIPVQVWE